MFSQVSIEAMLYRLSGEIPSKEAVNQRYRDLLELRESLVQKHYRRLIKTQPHADTTAKIALYKWSEEFVDEQMTEQYINGLVRVAVGKPSEWWESQALTFSLQEIYAMTDKEVAATGKTRAQLIEEDIVGPLLEDPIQELLERDPMIPDDPYHYTDPNELSDDFFEDYITDEDLTEEEYKAELEWARNCYDLTQLKSIFQLNVLIPSPLKRVLHFIQTTENRSERDVVTEALAHYLREHFTEDEIWYLGTFIPNYSKNQQK